MYSAGLDSPAAARGEAGIDCLGETGGRERERREGEKLVKKFLSSTPG